MYGHLHDLGHRTHLCRWWLLLLVMLLLLMVVEHGCAACCWCPILEVCIVTGPGHVKVAAAEIDACTAVVQLHGIWPEREEACVKGRVRELCAQRHGRQALCLAEVRWRLVYCRLSMLAAATGGVCGLLAHAEVARVTLQWRARRATDLPEDKVCSVRTVQFMREFQGSD